MSDVKMLVGSSDICTCGNYHLHMQEYIVLSLILLRHGINLKKINRSLDVLVILL